MCKSFAPLNTDDFILSCSKVCVVAIIIRLAVTDIEVNPCSSIYTTDVHKTRNQLKHRRAHIVTYELRKS
jgi:hypothetical protein